MLQNIKTLHGKKLAASDGDIGHVADFYFDDTSWAIRYLVANTANWLTGRLVLISPHALGLPDADSATIPVHLTRAQIENSPSIDTDKPVSRQYELDYYRYYGWPVYWDGGGSWGMGA
ncbi:MAG: PRC-barrel domain containing protein, partial [Opitutaceae bacterium]|nr:PRC-barrel domain containing protein [Opitutaceae bacterium]